MISGETVYSWLSTLSPGRLPIFIWTTQKLHQPHYQFWMMRLSVLLFPQELARVNTEAGRRKPPGRYDVIPATEMLYFPDFFSRLYSSIASY